MRATRSALSALLFALYVGVSLPAQPSAFVSEITDFWWNADESGWGINVTLQSDVAYATFFVYDNGQNPRCRSRSWRGASS